MSINLKNTKDVTTNGVKILAYGQAGAGKTRLIPTLPDVIAISAEGGLLSISGSSTPYVEISSIEQLTDVYMWVTSSEEAAQFNSVAIDSISEIAEVVLAHEKATTKDPRQAYGAMGDQMGRLVRQFRDLPKNIYMTAKLDRVQDEQGRLLNGPGMPGNKTAQQLPYFFDEVFALLDETCLHLSCIFTYSVCLFSHLLIHLFLQCNHFCNSRLFTSRYRVSSLSFHDRCIFWQVCERYHFFFR